MYINTSGLLRLLLGLLDRYSLRIWLNLLVPMTGLCLLSCGQSHILEQYRLFIAGSKGFESDLYLTDGNGSIIRQLTDTPSRTEMWPVPDPRTDRIYFEARTIPDKEIMICGLDMNTGREDTLYGPAPPGELWFALSPDAQRMAYVIPETTHTSLCIRDIRSGEEEIIYEPGHRFIRPEWSFDSKKIVCQIRENDERQWDLAVIDAETGDVRQVTDTPDLTEFKARWSPDGSRIIMSVSPGDDRSKVRITVLKPDGGGERFEFGDKNERIISAVWSAADILAAVRERPLPMEILIWPTGDISSPCMRSPLPEDWKRGRAVWSLDDKYLAVNVSGSRKMGTLWWRILILDASGHIVKWWPDTMNMYCPAWKHG